MDHSFIHSLHFHFTITIGLKNRGGLQCTKYDKKKALKQLGTIGDKHDDFSFYCTYLVPHFLPVLPPLFLR